MMEKYDVAILGGGPGGYVAANRCAREGLKTVLVEKDRIGGMCLNWGCIPSKSLMKSAKIYREILEADSWGIQGIEKKDILPDWEKMCFKAHRSAKTLTQRVKKLLEKLKIDIIIGFGEVKQGRKIEVGKKSLEYRNLIIATGSRYMLPDFGREARNFYTPKTLYEIERLPKSMTIIGAGVIGVEFAQLFSSLGTEVTLVEKSEKIMPYMDRDLIKGLLRILNRKRINICLGWNAWGMAGDALMMKKNGSEKMISSEIFLSAVTRSPNLRGLEFLMQKGLELDNRGFIRTDLRTRTTLPGVYAVGDVNGKFMLAHVASAEGTCAAETIAGKGKDLVYDFMPYCLYGSPEFASAGLTEDSALSQGFLTSVEKFPFSVNGKAVIEGAEGIEEGFVKVVYDKREREILGVHILGENATDLIPEAILAMETGASPEVLSMVAHSHPTLGSGLDI